MQMTRRDILAAGMAAAATGAFWSEEIHAQAGTARYRNVFAKLDRFVEQFMRDMHSPGMTLVLADRAGVQRVCAYGFGDLERQQKVRVEEIFQIGSISKSFLALVLLQLHEEGKLDLHKPVVEYLPWLRIQSAFAPITTHHLLTHSSGLAAAGEVFQTDPAERHLAAYAPGKHFYYNNMAFALLGHLAWTLDGRELPALLSERLFKPLGMSGTEPVIDFDIRERMAKSYQPYFSDRPYPRSGRLCEAPFIISSNAAGSIASTALDMGAYVQMIANHGRGPHRELISAESFELFSKRHIPAAEFGPTASYGYGIAVDQFEGHTMLRHTGGMVSFMSSIMVDVEAGIGAFASINAQQGYRPNAVAQYAIQLMRAQSEGRALPASPAPNDASVVENAADYAGTYRGERGTLGFVVEGKRLVMLRDGQRIVLEKLSEADQFQVPAKAMDRFALIFGRQAAGPESAKPGAPKPPVLDVGLGEQWYAKVPYDGPRQFDVPASWHSYVGHYRNDSPWLGSMRIVLRKGRLMMDGTTPLRPDGELFRLGDEPEGTEWLRFGEVVNGKCMHLKFSGADLWRVAVP
jgi:CubicO group peptidase (beta-lactamase class C family)